MGKNSAINSLSKIIGNVVMHKLLLRHTNKPESNDFLKSEIKEYSSNAFEKFQEFNWNSNDLNNIKIKILGRIRQLSKYYPDISYKEEEATSIAEEIINELSE